MFKGCSASWCKSSFLKQEFIACFMLQEALIKVLSYLRTVYVQTKKVVATHSTAAALTNVSAELLHFSVFTE